MTQIAQLQVNESNTYNEEIARQLLQVIGGSLFIALCAQIKIPLGFSPVPLTLQTLAVMIVGGLLGSRNGAMSVILYLAQISGGLPFAAGGTATPLALLGPTGGYFLGFIAQAYLVGWCVEKEKNFRSIRVLFTLFIVSIIQLGLGTMWLGAFVGMKNSMVMGFYPFIPGDTVKCIIATAALSKFR